jgi:hypothetical protein
MCDLLVAVVHCPSTDRGPACMAPDTGVPEEFVTRSATYTHPGAATTAKASTSAVYGGLQPAPNNQSDGDRRASAVHETIMIKVIILIIMMCAGRARNCYPQSHLTHSITLVRPWHSDHFESKRRATAHRLCSLQNRTLYSGTTVAASRKSSQSQSVHFADS